MEQEKVQKLTRAQLRVLEAISILQKQGKGLSPSRREIAAYLGHRTLSSVQDALHNLRSRGLVDWQGGKGRSLRLLKPEYLEGSKDD